jgi:hypothetical protein
VTRILYVEDNDDNVYTLKLRFELLDGFERKHPCGRVPPGRYLYRSDTQR